MFKLLHSLLTGAIVNIFLYWLAVAIFKYLQWPEPNIGIGGHIFASLMWAWYCYPYCEDLNEIKNRG